MLVETGIPQVGWSFLVIHLGPFLQKAIVQNILFCTWDTARRCRCGGRSNRPPPNSDDVRVTPTEDGGVVPFWDNPSAQRSLVCVTTPRCPMQQKQTNQNQNPNSCFPLKWWAGVERKLVEARGVLQVRSSQSVETDADSRVVLTGFEYGALASCSLVTLTSPRIPPL